VVFDTGVVMRSSVQYRTVDAFVVEFSMVTERVTNSDSAAFCMAGGVCRLSRGYLRDVAVGQVR
jgi:hypothetical protein